MTDTTTPPRCPSCGATMHEIGVNLFVCSAAHLILVEPYRGEDIVVDDSRMRIIDQLRIERTELLEENEKLRASLHNRDVVLEAYRIEHEQHALSPARVPLCPMCGAKMTRIERETAYWRCEVDGTVMSDIGAVVYGHTPARVPCPACEGTGVMHVAIPTMADGYVISKKCLVCRGRGDVPPALAAAWLADGDEEAK